MSPRCGSRHYYPLLVLSTLTLYDASLVILRLGGLLSFEHPEWLLLAAAFFVSGPGAWAIAAQGVEPRRFLASVAPLGAIGVVYSAALTKALAGGGLVDEAAVRSLAAATLMLLGAMELLLVEDARRVMNGFTRRCLSGIPLYIWPLIVLFTGLAVEAALSGRPLALLPLAAAVAYSAASRPVGEARCTVAASAAVALPLAMLAFHDPLVAAAATLAATLLATAPHAPATLLEERPSVVVRLVLLGLAAVAAASPAKLDAAALAGEATVYATVAALGWLITATVAAAAGRSRAVVEAARSPVLRHAAGFALVLAGLHVAGTAWDPGLAVLAASAAAAAVNQAARARLETLQPLPGHPS